jgi:hypothetical protein
MADGEWQMLNGKAQERFNHSMDTILLAPLSFAFCPLSFAAFPSRSVLPARCLIRITLATLLGPRTAP